MIAAPFMMHVHDVGDVIMSLSLFAGRSQLKTSSIHVSASRWLRHCKYQMQIQCVPPIFIFQGVRKMYENIKFMKLGEPEKITVFPEYAIFALRSALFFQ